MNILQKMFDIHREGITMEKLMEEVQKNSRLLQAVLMLQVRDYQKKGGSERIELLLAASGLGYQDIAEVLGKKPDAVRMLLKRNK